MYCLGSKGSDHEVVVATESFVCSLPEHLSYNEVRVINDIMIFKVLCKCHPS